MATEVVGAFGRIDVLVNNVGDMAASQMSWRELTPESLDHTLKLDIKGTLLMTHEFGRRMLDDQQSGVIVNIGSRVVVEGSPPRAAVRGGEVRDPRHLEVVRARTRPACPRQHARPGFRRDGDAA